MSRTVEDRVAKLEAELLDVFEVLHQLPGAEGVRFDIRKAAEQRRFAEIAALPMPELLAEVSAMDHYTRTRWFSTLDEARSFEIVRCASPGQQSKLLDCVPPGVARKARIWALPVEKHVSLWFVPDLKADPNADKITLNVGGLVFSPGGGGIAMKLADWQSLLQGSTTLQSLIASGTIRVHPMGEDECRRRMAGEQ